MYTAVLTCIVSIVVCAHFNADVYLRDQVTCQKIFMYDIPWFLEVYEKLIKFHYAGVCAHIQLYLHVYKFVVSILFIVHILIRDNEIIRLCAKNLYFWHPLIFEDLPDADKFPLCRRVVHRLQWPFCIVPANWRRESWILRYSLFWRQFAWRVLTENSSGGCQGFWKFIC
jgi:hypothetical protein